MKIEELEETIADLKTRRAELAREHEAARETETAAQKALVDGSGTAEKAATARGTAEVLGDALRVKDAEIARLKADIAQTEAASKRSAQISAAVETAQRGTLASERKVEAMRQAGEALQNHGGLANEFARAVDKEREHLRAQIAEIAEVETYLVLPTHGTGVDDSDPRRIAIIRVLGEFAGAGGDVNFGSKSVGHVPHLQLVEDAMRKLKKETS